MENENNNQHVPNDTEKSKSRPVSFYDNNVNSTNSYTNEKNGKLDRTSSRCEGSPSQAHLLMTTVPQNLAAQQLGGKHTPTRNSLRHSRMIVMNKHGRVPKKYLPAAIRFHKWVKSLIISILVLSLLILAISFGMILWSVQLSEYNYHHMGYWSGCTLLVVGIPGCLYMCCFEKEYPGRKISWLYASLKTCTLLNAIICLAGPIYGAYLCSITLVSLTTSTCGPALHYDPLNTTCKCTRNETSMFLYGSFHYKDLGCHEVYNYLIPILGFLFTCSLLGALAVLIYILIQWRSGMTLCYYWRYRKRNEIYYRSKTANGGDDGSR